MRFSPGQQVSNWMQVSRPESDRPPVAVPFWLFVPGEYEKRPEGWPLMLFLHGLGESGDGRNLHVVKRHGPPKIAEEDRDFPFILVSPQCARPERDIRSAWDVELLARVLDCVERQLRVDSSRIYVTGLSMGGFGTWRMAARFPQRIAAAVPMCGGGDPASAERLAHVPIWCFHGEQDRVVPVEHSEVMVEAVGRAGGHVRFTLYPDLEHDCWTESYADPELYAWLLNHSKTVQS